MAAHLKKRVYEEFTKVVQVSEEGSELCRVTSVSVGRAVVAAWGLTRGGFLEKGSVGAASGLGRVTAGPRGDVGGMWWPQLGEGENSNSFRAGRCRRRD